MNSWLSSQRNVRLLILVTNLVYITSILLKMCLSNQAYFGENAFQLTNLFFYAWVVLSWLLIKDTRLYFLSSFLLILDLPANLKQKIQALLTGYLHISNPWLIHFCLLALLALFVFIIYRYKVMRYCQVFLLFFYLVSLFTIAFQTKRTYAAALHLSAPVSTVSKNYYFLLFDEYPNEQLLRQHKLCGPADYPGSFLPKEGFTGDQNSHTNYISTVRSTINFLTGSLQAGYNVDDAIDALDSNVFSHNSHYSFTAFSILDHHNRLNSLFAKYYFYNFNNLLTQKAIPWCISRFSKRGAGDYTDCDAYNTDAFAKLEDVAKSGKPHVAYIHFFTPHTYPLVRGLPISVRIQNANQWMLKCISAINRNDPGAGVIIFSDHGLREQNIPFKLWNRNLLYYRNVSIDTALVNRLGLVALSKSIKY